MVRPDPAPIPPSSEPDEAAALRAARHDLTRFAPVYERYVGRIYAYCRHRVGAQEAEDVTSQVFTQALAGLGGYRSGSVAAWLFRIAHNCVVDHLRYRRPQVSLDGLDMPDGRGDLGESLAQQEDLRLARALLATLDDAERELVTLKLVGGLNAGEIGAVLGKSAVAVRVEWHRLLRRLRAHARTLERMGGPHD